MLDLHAVILFGLGSFLLLWNIIAWLHHSVDGVLEGTVYKGLFGGMIAGILLIIVATLVQIYA